ncbi:MAG: 16S rRNA processing protein RimM [Clostridia bacterium]|nr:16S rRNA processing protein RimM [Clostridia bacterium]
MPRVQFLEAGQIVGTHGVRGEMRVQPWCDSPEVFCKLKRVYLDERGATSLKVKSRPQKNMVLMKAEGVESIPEAEELRNTVVYLNRDDLHLPKGTFFIQDLIGMSIYNVDTDEKLGVLEDVSSTGANNVYHMKTQEGKEVLIPAIPSVVKEINLDADSIKIFVIKGLLDDDEN